ncbi:MAG: DEAD/DEAH box helicase [archaeon]
MLKGITPREYQSNIFEKCTKRNCLVVLPTGLGKTLVALMLAIERMKQFPDSQILFLAPTRPLVEQHYDYFKKYSELKNMHIFTGKINAKKRAEIWEKAKVIFSTPQCIQNDLKKQLIDLSDVSLLVEDECHRCLKNYSYTFVVKKYIEEAKHARILGITASPGSSSQVIKEICNNLEIKAVEIRTRDSEDVKKYLQELTKEVIYVEFPEDFKLIKKWLDTLYNKKIEELKNRKLLYGGAYKTNLLELQKRLFQKIYSGEKHFNVLKGVSLCAQAIKLGHTVEMLETQGLGSCFEYMKKLFDEDHQNKSKAAKNIVNSKEFQDSYLLVGRMLQEEREHPKLAALLSKIKEELLSKEELKVLIFSQYRFSVNKIDKILKENGLKSKVFIGQSKGLTQLEQKSILNQFRTGKINFLVSTSIGEEGLDIPEVDLVIFYEPVPSAIRKIQRAGRTARLKPGKLVIFVTKGTRDEAYFWAAHHKEKKMYDTLDKIKDGFDKKKKQMEISEF